MTQVCLSVCHRRQSSVTFVYCDQTAIDRLMIYAQASIWVQQAPNSIEIVKPLSSSGGLSGPTLSSVLQTLLQLQKGIYG